MKNIFKILSLLIVGLLLTACGTKVLFKAQEPKTGAAILYVYANDTMSDDDSMQNDKFKLRINKQNVKGELNGGEYKIFDMKPALILVSAVRTNIEEHFVKLNLEAGKTYYLKIQPSSYGEEFTFEEVNANKGQKALAKTSLAGSFALDVTTYVPDFAGSTATDGNTTAVPAMSEAEIDAMINKKLDDRMKAAAAVPVIAPVATPAITSTPIAPIAQTPSAPRMSKADQMDALERAHGMKEKGILTDAEFKEMKMDILAK